MRDRIWSVDDDPSIGYERLTLFRKFTDIFFITILNLLPGGFSKFIKHTNGSAKGVLENKTTHKALEILYNHGFPSHHKNFFQRIFLKIWFNLHNPKSVRNRLKLVRKEIRVAIESIDRRDDDIRVLSIASGSARAVLEALSEVNPRQNKVSVVFLDNNPKALEYSKELKSEVLNLDNDWKFSWAEDTASNFRKYTQGPNSLDLVEIVGLFDYFSNEKVLEILSEVYKYLSPKGVVITSNITDNRERKFITKVVGWPMIYKEPEEMVGIMLKAGFKMENIRLVYEPLKIHVVLIAKK